jgi:hypothetical protein
MSADDKPQIDSTKLAYSIQSLAEAVEISVSAIRNEINDSKLAPKYYGRKPLIPSDEAIRWFNALPDERPAA